MLRQSSRSLAIALLVLLSASAHPAAADVDDQKLADCLSTGKTQASMNDCVVRATDRWERRVEAAYHKLLVGLEVSSRGPLERSQRAWTSYRSAEQAFADAHRIGHEGSAERLQGATLRMEEVRNRALTLEIYLFNK